ncbi:MAG: SDR family NAD(P)-dependent oxidoreductase [Chloroflexi bacterium]|nr:SDR family NAD(P)-dependent oxidoreductase [Chloroflexota bacterium]
MDLEGSKVVVIGGAGFIGSHVVEELLAEPVKEVVVFDNLTRGTRGNLERALADRRVSLFAGDITQTDVLDAALRGADYVFHLAALWLLHCYEYPRAAFQVNVEGTFNVLEACVRNKVKKLVYSSSASVYGDALVVPMTEEHPYNNRTFYGATKIAGEHMCRAFHDRYGLEYVGLRYMNVYGPRQDYHGAYTAVMMKMMDRIDQGQPLVVYGDGSQTYDFIYVADVGLANVCAMKAAASDSFYNVGRGVGTSIKELAELFLEITGADVGIQYEPAGQTFVTQRIGSTERARQELGFEAGVELPEGLQRLIEWRRADQQAARAREARR